MKKTVKVSDIRKMIKMFGLSEEEQYWLNDIADDINDERKMPSYNTQLSFIMSPNCCTLNTERYHALASILLYFGLRVQKEVGPRFNETCEELGKVLNATPKWIARIFRGMSFSNPRWDKKVYCADRCGLNTLELTK